MDRQSLIVLLASLQLYEKQSVLYHGLVLAYITLCPSTTGRRGYSSRPRTGSCFLNHLVDSQSHRKTVFAVPIVSWQLLKYLKTIDILWQDNGWPHKRCLPKMKNELLIDSCVCTMRIQTMQKTVNYRFTRQKIFKKNKKNVVEHKKCDDIITGNVLSHTMLTEVCGHLCVWGTVFLKTEPYRLNKRQECCLNFPQQTSEQVLHALAKLFFNWFIVLKHSFTDALVLALRLHVTPPSPAWTLSL